MPKYEFEIVVTMEEKFVVEAVDVENAINIFKHEMSDSERKVIADLYYDGRIVGVKTIND